ncbi:LPXTG cell wall anchor domain-containing protein, partial [Aerococcaceae bacterium INB8]
NETPGKDEPGNETPGTDEPGNDIPGTDEPGNETPGIDEPGNETPGTDEPGDATPTPEQPGEGTPTSEKPGLDRPIEVSTPTDSKQTMIETFEETPSSNDVSKAGFTGGETLPNTGSNSWPFASIGAFLLSLGIGVLEVPKKKKD